MSRGQGHRRWPAPAQKIRGILESSRDERRNFQPRAVVEFPVRQEVAQVGWAMPSNGELLDGDVVPLLISQAAEGWLAGGIGDSFRPQLLDGF